MDIRIEGHGSIWLFRPLTKAGEDWLTDNTEGQWFGNALAVEPRYAADLIAGAAGDGLAVQL